MLNGLSQINVEFTSRCNKACWMCGRRERERLYGNQDYGDIEFSLLEKLSLQVPSGITIACHNNGEPLLYPRFGEGVSLFKNRGCFVYCDTNGKLLLEKKDEIINNLDAISVSVIENDIPEEKEQQYANLRQFIYHKGYLKPHIILRFVGKIEDEERYERLNLPIARRTLHLPKGSIGYRKSPVIPEHGVCQDFLNRLAVDRHGNVSCCVRFDPMGKLILGNLKDTTLDECWNGEKRMKMWELHTTGQRHLISFCGDSCQFWGVPTSD